MGVPFMDYIIGDQITIPSNQKDNYSEKVIWMPDSFMPLDTLSKISSFPLSRRFYSLPEDSFVFCAFNNSYKIVPEQFNIWCQILKSVPESVLWLSATSELAQVNLKVEASKAGLEPNRIIFSEFLDSRADHLARYSLADLFLDTIPHNAHATANDALVAGLPVLTCLGDCFAGRVAASLITAVGLPELVTSNLETYMQKAIRIANQPDEAIRLRAHLSKRSNKIWSRDAYTRDFEAALKTAYRNSLSDLDPSDFLVTK